MFFGSYQHTLDAKGRMIIPSRLKDQVGDRLFIMKGYDGCLSVYKEEDFLNKIAELKKLPFNKRESRDVTRVEMSSVVNLEIDDGGRILLPKRVLTEHNIGRKIMIVGVIDHFEIWDLDAWEDYISKKNDLYEETADSLNKQE